jgi:hypothetical protein
MIVMIMRVDPLDVDLASINFCYILLPLPSVSPDLLQVVSEPTRVDLTIILDDESIG